MSLRLLALLVAFATAPVAAQQPQLANPASQNCIAKGGQLTMEKNGAGGAFGVCTFPDNLQCEEWAMMRGDCRTGGIKVAGYVTPAARYCAITGGTYKITSASNTPNEQGTCTFKGGKSCNAKAYFDARCSREVTRTAAAPAKTINAKFACAGGKTIDATFVNTGGGSVKLALSDGRSLTLPQAMSASGARYANKDESFVFWNKGNTAFIDEGGKMTYQDCATKQ